MGKRAAVLSLLLNLTNSILELFFTIDVMLNYEICVSLEQYNVVHQQRALYFFMSHCLPVA